MTPLRENAAFAAEPRIEPRIGTGEARGFAVASGSQPGRRGGNQDAVWTRLSEDGRARTAALALADGMGGQPGGDIASKLAIEGIAHFFGAWEREDAADPTEMREGLNGALKALSLRLRRHDARMGTTIAAVYIRGTRFVFSHLGDSRIYRFRAGELTRLTRDHTFAQRMVDEGELDELSATSHRSRHALTRYVGMADPQPVTRSARLTAGDRLLLTSDGVHDVLPDWCIARILRHQATPEAAVVKILQTVRERSGRDDASAIVFNRRA
ncbi:MAG: PP2C family serine/threonine-protein phosphatase [Myxococcota bacterium]